MDREIRELHQVFRDDVSALRSLVALLREEREAIISRDVTELERVTGAKGEYLDQLEQSSRVRDGLLERIGITAEPDPMHRFATDQATLDVVPEFHETWLQLKDALGNVRRENIINGRLVSRSRQTLNHLIDILRGKADAPSLYGREGHKDGDADRQEIARA